MRRSKSYAVAARELGRDLRAAVSRAVIAELHRRRPGLHFAIAAAHAVAFLAAGTAAFTSADPRVWMPCAVLMGFGVLGFTVLLHEVVHKAVFSRRRPRASRLLGLAYAIPSGLSPSQFERWHLDHHDNLGTTDDDPKRAHLSPKRNARWLKLLYLTPALFPIYFGAARRASARYDDALRARIRRERLLTIAVHASALAGLVALGGWGAAARAYLVPYFFVFPVAFTLNRLGQHYDVRRADVAQWTTRVDGNALWRLLYLNSNHHLEHHYFPGVPLYNLPALSRALRPLYAARDIRNRTYGALLWGWFVDNAAPHSDFAAARGGISELRESPTSERTPSRALSAHEIDAALLRHLPPAETEPRRLHEAMLHAVRTPGKRVRPRLLLAVAASARAPGTALPHDLVMRAICAIEYIHAASLVHDDLPCFDGADLRRGQPTVHRRYGEATAVLVGDALLARGFEVLAGTEATHAPLALRALSLLAAATGSREGIIGGQALELTCAPLDIALYHRMKTGALFRWSAEVGALLAGARDPGAWAALGVDLGRLFQIADDIIDAQRPSGEHGKPAGVDERLDRPNQVRESGFTSSALVLRSLLGDLRERAVALAVDPAPIVEFLDRLAAHVEPLAAEPRAEVACQA